MAEGGSDFVKIHKGGGLGVSSQDLGTRRLIKDRPKSRQPAPQKESLSDIAAFHNRVTTAQYRGFISDYERHKRYMKDYQYYYGGKSKPIIAKGENDFDVLQRNFQFIRDEYEDLDALTSEDERKKYEAELSLAYYRKLHKEYAIANLSRFESGQVGLAWRTESQVISGKGQFICGNISCSENDKLKEFELDFVYKENDETKNELVKVCLCEECAYKLNYKKIKKKEEKKRKRKREKEKERTRKKRKLK